MSHYGYEHAMKPLWLYRPLLNWQDIYAWAARNGIRKLMPPEQFHSTLATVRIPVEWGNLELQKNEIVLPIDHRAIQIFGYTIKAIAFSNPLFKARHDELLDLYPAMDHPIHRSHVSIYRGGKMPIQEYFGGLHFGPEIAVEFDEMSGRNIKHVKVNDYLTD